MDPKVEKLVKQWRATLTDRERALHDLAAVKLKKTIVPVHKEGEKEDIDNGSYYAEKCHAFKAWMKKQTNA